MSQEESEVEQHARDRLGTTIRDKYRLDRILGTGGMAVVYSATHRNKKQFALKMLHRELSVHQTIRSRFLREGYAANSFKHGGVVAVLDDDVAEDGSAFLVMELLEGDDLDHIARRHGYRLPAAAVLAVGFQLLDVLAAAHDKGIVHRDIKPANLFLVEEGTVKVLDFGIARVRDALATGSKATASGTLLGTPGFMAPEQALGNMDAIDGQTDVWAAGATLFALLTGQAAHAGTTTPELMVAGATQSARRLLEVGPELHPRLASLIDRALAFDKSMRWPSAAAMRDAIVETYLALQGEPISRAPLAVLLAPAAMAPPLASADTAVLFPDAAVPAQRAPGSAVGTLLMGGRELNAPPGPVFQKTAPLPESFRARQPSAPVVPPSSPPAIKTAIMAGAPAPRAAAPLASPSTIGSLSSTTAYVLPGVASGKRVEWIAVAMVLMAVPIGTTLALRRPGGAIATAAPMEPAGPAARTLSSEPAPTTSAFADAPTSSPSPHAVAPLGTSRPRQPRAATPPSPPIATAPPATLTTNTPATPCKLGESVDGNGESHFSCPCARCE